MFFMQLKKQGDILYAHLEGNLSFHETHQIEHYLIPYLQRNNIKSLYCDCSKLKKIDIDGKYALLNIKIQMKKQKGNFLLCNMKKSMKEGLIGFHFKVRNLQKLEA